MLFEASPGGVYRFSGYSTHSDYILEREESEGVQIGDVTVMLSQEPTSVEAETENVTVAQGVKTTLKRSRTVQRMVSITKNEEELRSISGSLSTIKGEIMSKVELTLNQSLSQSDTVERTHEFDGKEGGTYKLTWVEYFREGTATVTVQGASQTIPFRIRVSADLIVQKAK